jgi:hypothetical protein
MLYTVRLIRAVAAPEGRGTGLASDPSVTVNRGEPAAADTHLVESG